MGIKSLDPESRIGDPGMQVVARGDELMIRARFSRLQGDLDGFLAELRNAILVWMRRHPRFTSERAGEARENTPIGAEVNDIRLPINIDEERELEKVAEDGPAAVYRWIYGPKSLMAKAMDGVSWLQFGVENTSDGCRRILRSIRDHRADLRTLRRLRR